jgi:hypothetical protein
LKPYANFIKFRALLPEFAVAGNGFLNSAQQVLTANWFGQELMRPFFHRAHRHRNIAVTGNEDDRNLDVRAVQFELEIKAA